MIHGVAATTRRRNLWRWGSWLGCVVFGLGMAVLVAGFTDESVRVAVSGAVVLDRRGDG